MLFFFLRSEAESCVGFREPNSLNSKADELGGIVSDKEKEHKKFSVMIWYCGDHRYVLVCSVMSCFSAICLFSYLKQKKMRCCEKKYNIYLNK